MNLPKSNRFTHRPLCCQTGRRTSFFGNISYGAFCVGPYSIRNPAFISIGIDGYTASINNITLLANTNKDDALLDNITRCGRVGGSFETL
jgi:hypothetical protein